MTGITKEDRAELRRLNEEREHSLEGITIMQEEGLLESVPKLLDALDEAERERDEWVLTCDGLKAEQKKAERRIAELEAIIEETEREEDRDNGQFGVGA